MSDPRASCLSPFELRRIQAKRAGAKHPAAVDATAQSTAAVRPNTEAAAEAVQLFVESHDMKNPVGTGLLTLLEQQRTALQAGDTRLAAELECEIAVAKDADAMARRIAGITAEAPAIIDREAETPDEMARRIAGVK
jgi:hypothetical protein